MQLYSSVVP